MVDPKRDDPKPTETKSGPVKPPVLDLKARETKPESESAKPEATKPAEPKDATPKPTPPKTPMPVEPEREFAFGAAIAGAVLGLAAAYGLALLGYWPSAPAPVVQADPRLAQLGSAIPELQTVTQTTQSELSALNARVAGLEKAGGAAAASAPAVDLGGIQADIAALTARVEGLGAAPANAVTPADIEALKTSLTGFGTRLDELGARMGTTEAGVRTLETSVTATTAALAEQPADVGAVLQLPLVLSGFESAFATGRPYQTELAALRAAVPTASIPTDIANGATTGLTRPDVIASKFATVLPAMLAGRPANPEAGWQDGALDWLRSAIALRPTGELPGDDPEAVVSRLEAAIARRDYQAAETLMGSLPEPMRAAAGDVPALIHAQAEAGKFLEALRTQAL
ncbi:MAG: hypothetical protein JWQ65_3127, partial [Devosia sp.]|nr:hypothetical protein [Devosia sp.]